MQFFCILFSKRFYPEAIMYGASSKDDEKKSVLVRNAYLRYGPKSVVLNGLDLTVKNGSIYGLLGPSGCGKTTLLNCVVGVKRLDSGNITLSVTDRSEIGYMPQEISLNEECTISEVYHFYGKLYGITEEKIEEMDKNLSSLLELPPSTRMISTCSGGQKRRVSMAVTLLHDPKFFILDEPTVGVDPLLSNKIWEYFTSLVEERGVTLIVTTHYIEEARFADRIGLMRKGVMVAEDSPDALLKTFNRSTLEGVFYEISTKQDAEKERETSYPKFNPNVPPFRNDEWFKFKRFRAHFVKNLHWTKRNFTVTAFVILLPAVLFAIVTQLSSTDGYPRGLKPYAYVNEEAHCENASKKVLSKPCAPSYPLSCRFLMKISPLYSLYEVDNVGNGLDQVRTGRAAGVLRFNDKFSVHLMGRLQEQASATSIDLENSYVDAWMDMSEFGISLRSETDFFDKIIELLQDLCEECDYNRNVASIPIKHWAFSQQSNQTVNLQDLQSLSVMEHINDAMGLIQSVLAPYFVSVAFYTTMMFTASTIIQERLSGSFERSKVAGLTTFEILASQFSTEMIVIVVQNILSFAILYGFNDFPMRGSFPLSVFIIFLSQIFGSVYGLLLAILIREEKNVSYFGVGTILTLFLLTGLMWPREGLHWSLQYLSALIPTTLTAISYHNVTVKGWGIAHPGVLTGIFSSLAGTGVLILASFLCVRFKIGSFY